MIKTIAYAAALLLCTDTWAATCTWTARQSTLAARTARNFS